MEIDNIYNMDCLEGMKQIPDGTIDAVICDLPYGVLNKQNEHVKWDCPIPFEPLWEQYLRITKEHAPIVLFGQGMFTAQTMMSQPDLWRYNWVWDKGRVSDFFNANKRPLKCTEDIMVFCKHEPIYHPQMIVGTKHERRNSRSKYHEATNRCFGGIKDNGTRTSDEYFPRRLIHIQNYVEKNLHPTQKPVDLLRYLVLTYTNEGDTVLDNCMGSGTTAIACIKERRHFIGFELSKEYFDKAVRRIKAEQAQLTLF